MVGVVQPSKHTITPRTHTCAHTHTHTHVHAHKHISASWRETSCIQSPFTENWFEIISSYSWFQLCLFSPSCLGHTACAALVQSWRLGVWLEDVSTAPPCVEVQVKSTATTPRSWWEIDLHSWNESGTTLINYNSKMLLAVHQVHQVK